VPRFGERGLAHMIASQAGEAIQLLGVCFLWEAPERAIGVDRRAGKRGLAAASRTPRATAWISPWCFPNRNVSPPEPSRRIR
jgi:hypothetical protein